MRKRGSFLFKGFQGKKMEKVSSGWGCSQEKRLSEEKFN